MACSEKLQRNKTRVASELPEELVCGEILTRLPIKSAVRFKCVSKSWLSLFSNPEFSKQRLTLNTTQNPNEYDCLIATKSDKIVVLSRYNETPAPLSRGGFCLVGSIRGLVCLCDCFGSKLSLWNPAIHQSKEFTLPSNRHYDKTSTEGFGFDPVSDNYKVVVLSRDLRSASVYHSNSDSWIDVFVPDNVYLLQNREYLLDTQITIIKDCPYWIFYRYTHHRHPYKTQHRYETQVLVPTAVYLTIVKFDAGSNEFELLPEFYFDVKVSGERYAKFTYKFVDMNDCPTLIVCDKKSSKCMLDIYSLDGEEECCVWTRTYSIGPIDFRRPFWDVSQGFYGGEIVFHDHGMFFCYDRKTDTIKRLSRPSTSISYTKSCFRYTPSLVFLEGMKSV